MADHIKETMRERGLSLKAAINETLRLGFIAQKQKRAITSFEIEPVAMGQLREGLSYDCIGKLLEEADGASYK